MDFKLPPYTLLPLLENAVMHGLRTQDRVGSIRVTVRAKHECVLLCIEDNGTGFSEEQLQCWRRGDLENFPKSGNGIGLQNVQLRLLRQYGFGLVLGMSEWGGAKISMMLPRR
jgi:sensor histidine kinase YesM